MTKRTIWLVVSGLMVLSLVLAACAPKVTEEKEAVTEKKEVVTEKKEVVTEKKEVVAEKKEVEMVVDALGRLVPKPQYGGVLRFVVTSDPSTGFSRSGLNREPPSANYLHMTNERLLAKDRLKGPAGSGEWLGIYNLRPLPEQMVGALAESWEIIQPDTLKFKIRKGIHWQDKAPTYGAEFTAEDVVYTFLARWKRPGGIYPTNYPYLSNMAKPEESIYIDPGDPRTVVFKTQAGMLGPMWDYVPNFDFIIPKALGPIEGEGFGDWRGVVGTGPFLLTDYVRGGSLTWQRNPNYWGKDQLHPQNQLPYLDGVKVFIIPDLSTQFAALRTGKLDALYAIEAEEAESLMKTNPELLWLEKLGGGPSLDMRNDVAPFNDVRVRRAMYMAIDHDEILRDYYGGKGEKLFYPAMPIAEHKDAFVPLEQMPELVQQMYGYYPDKAKQLLAEAGYPNGFTTSITLSSADEENIDLAAVVAAYWAKVGVTLKLDVREPAVYNSMRSAFTYPHGTWNSINEGELDIFRTTRPGTRMNYTRNNEPLIEKTYQAISAVYFDWKEKARIAREAMPELQLLAVQVRLPIPVVYNLWQPWLKGFQGEAFAERPSASPPGLLVSYYVWLDQEMKKAMGR